MGQVSSNAEPPLPPPHTPHTTHTNTHSSLPLPIEAQVICHQGSPVPRCLLFGVFFGGCFEWHVLCMCTGLMCRSFAVLCWDVHVLLVLSATILCVYEVCTKHPAGIRLDWYWQVQAMQAGTNTSQHLPSEDCILVMVMGCRHLWLCYHFVSRRLEYVKSWSVVCERDRLWQFRPPSGTDFIPTPCQLS